MTEYVIMPGTDYQAICDAVRAKNETTDLLRSGELAAAIAAIKSEDLLAACLNNTLTEYSSDEVTEVPHYLFYEAPLNRISLPNATKIGSYAFWYALHLAEINLPQVTELGNYAFNNCQALAEANLPQVTKIGAYAFYLTPLSAINAPKLQTIGKYAFGKTRLISVALPSVTSLGAAAFVECASLTTVDLGPDLTVLDDQAFSYCTALETVILRSESVCTMKYTSAFSNTPFAAGGTGGTVYVPEALIEEYKAATNWVTLYEAGTCSFAAIEGSEYE